MHRTGRGQGVAIILHLGSELPAEIDQQSGLAGNLRRIFETLGIERVMRDASPTLSSYLEAKEPLVEGAPVSPGGGLEPHEVSERSAG